MSRNLGRTDCYYCNYPVVLIGEPRPITKQDRYNYFDEYDGMTVAFAECPACLARYLAWVTPPPNKQHHDIDSGNKFYDLSFRISFNNEPDERDLPVYDVKKVYIRTGLFSMSQGGYVNLKQIDIPDE
jgi:hypothetical protein